MFDSFYRVGPKTFTPFLTGSFGHSSRDKLALASRIANIIRRQAVVLIISATVAANAGQMFWQFLEISQQR
jgi:hypothetical protein